MAATTYQIFYRYINENTGLPIVNDLSIPYEERMDLVTDRHKINNGTAGQKAEAEEVLEDWLIDGNSASDSRNDMLFVYGGTKKIIHKQWNSSSAIWTTPSGVPGSYPYVIKDVYLRVNMTPWLKAGRYASLQSAIERCKQLGEAIGLVNVKLIKIVPFAQHIKIV